MELLITTGEAGKVSVNGRCEIHTAEGQEFPVLPSEFGETIPAGGLVEALSRVIPAVSTDEVRYILTGVYVDLGKGKVVATDGSRLHMDDIDAEGGPALVVPASAVRLLCKFKGENLITLPGPEGKHAAFSVGGGTLTARLMEGNYPDWEQVMPTKLATTTFAASEFLTLIEGAKPLAQGVIRLTINGALVISSEAEHGKYEWRIPCIVEEPREGELSYSFNHEYLIDAIRAFPAERVSLGTPETYGACLVNGKAIVMPVRT